MLLGTGAGGAAALLDRVSVWRFLSPPPALLRGVLVDADGKRICDESRYGAAIGDRDRPPRRPGVAVRGPGHDRRGPAAATRLDAVVPAAAGVVPADARAGDRGHGGRGRGQGRRRPRRPGGDGGRLQRGRPPPRTARRRHADPAGKPPDLVRPAGSAAVLADRLLDPAPAAQPGPGAHPRRPGGRPRDRPGAAHRTGRRYPACTRRAAAPWACAHARTSAGCPSPTACSPAGGQAATRRPRRRLKSYCSTCRRRKAKNRRLPCNRWQLFAVGFLSSVRFRSGNPSGAGGRLIP